ncbi:MAG: ThuA domain-containing protein [Planctomycetota bacterium]
MTRRRIVLAFGVLLLLATLAAAQEPLDVVVIAGELDDHPRGTHEYEKAALLLAHWLEQSDNGPPIRARAHLGGWPEDDRVLDDAEAIVVISAGSDRDEAAHPLLAPGRLERLDGLMARGVGLVAIHWTTFVPIQKAGDRFLEWIGGHFDYESGPPAGQWASRITTLEATLRPGDHPITRGLSPFSLTDEYYHHLRFRPSDSRRTDILTAGIPGSGDQVVAWAVERQDGGRGFGFTGGHFFDNYFNASFRTLLLNAITWTAGGEVPLGGVRIGDEARRIQAAILTGHHHPAHDWRATSVALKEILERDPRVSARVHDDIEILATGALKSADVLVLNYCNWERPGLSEASQQALLAHLDRGGGISVIHFANGAFHDSLPGAEDSDWPAYRERIARRVWDHGTSGHDAFGAFSVKPGGEAHPITAGLSPWTTTDELYYRQVGELEAQPLAWARSKDTAREEPMAWAFDSANGRVFQTVLGHAAESIRSAGTAELIRRGSAWAASREILPLPVEPFTRRIGTIIEAGRFGQALDARREPLVLGSRPEYAKPPITVECQARLEGAGGFNVLVANERKESATHWEIYSYAGSGAFAAYLPGYEPSEIVSETRITDDRWHHVAMSFDGETVTLWVDGDRVHSQAVTPKPGATSRPGPLMFGMAESDGYRVVPCRGLIDEIRISNVVRDPVSAPTGAQPADSATIGLWRFDGDRPYQDFSPLANSLAAEPRLDPAWTPRGAPTYKADAWEREGDDDWIDARNQEMDSGPFLSHSILLTGARGLPKTARGIAIRLGDSQEASMLFDATTLRWAAAWRGGYLQMSPARFGLLRAPTIGAEPEIFTLPELGWAHGGTFEDDRPSKHIPPDAQDARYEGLYLHGDRTILEMTIEGRSVLESPWFETRGGIGRYVRQLEIAPGDRNLRALVCAIDSEPQEERGAWIAGSGDAWTAVRLPASSGFRLINAGPRLELAIAPAAEPLRARLELFHGSRAELEAFLAEKDAAEPADLSAWTHGGPPRWGEPLRTRGELGEAKDGFAVDTLTLPFDNRYGALLYASGLDFLPSGELAMCTVHGDVWLVSGVDEDLNELHWRRFATGLYQPLGLKVVGGRIHVLGRDQITILEDLNDDGEADHYQNFSNRLAVPGEDHKYAMNLETDSQGRFYFIKSGERSTRHGGAMLRVSPDGRDIEVFATGYRHANGLGMGPGDVVTSADNEGNWVPVTRLDLVRPGGFYGFQPANRDPESQATFDAPLVWMPRSLDNSAGSQVWVPEGQWGPLGGELLHLSYGRCQAILVLRQEVGDFTQGAAMRLPAEFLSGSARGRFRPEDGHLYVCGLAGWQTAAREDGCLQRVRYTGGALHLPVAFEATTEGMTLSFSEPLDPEVARDPASWDLERWGYRYSERYGSKHWSIERPDVEGHDPVAVRSAQLSEDGRTVKLRFDAIAPVMQMRVRYELRDREGAPFVGELFTTIHALASGE